jgi:hypothetical protein
MMNKEQFLPITTGPSRSQSVKTGHVTDDGMSLESIDLLLDDYSSTDNGDFAQGLRNMGLISNTANLPDTSLPPSKSAKSAKRRPTETGTSPRPKKRDPPASKIVTESGGSPTRRISNDSRRRRQIRPAFESTHRLLTFAELLDDQPLDALGGAPEQKSATYTDSDAVEARLSEYLDMALRAVVQSIRAEIMGMLESPRSLDDITSDFLSTLRMELRQAINFQSAPISYDWFEIGSCDDFHSGMKAAQKIHTLSAPAAAESVRLARGLVNGYRISREESLHTPLSDLSCEIRKLRKAKTQRFRDKIMAEQQMSKTKRELVQLELAEIDHRADVQLLKNRCDRLEMRFGRPHQSYNIAESIREMLTELGDQSLVPALIVGNHSFQIRERLEVIGELRIAENRQHKLLIQSIATLKAVSEIPPYVIHVEEDSGYISQAEISAAPIRMKLEEIQKKRNQSLEEFSSFLDNPVRHRRHFRTHRLRHSRS